MKLLFLDTETTGITTDKDRLVSIAYKIDDTLRHEFFKPPLPISIDAMATHHITNEMVADKPTFTGSHMYKEMETLLPDHILVAHNAPFDINILENEGLKVPQFICTYRVAHHLDTEGNIPRFSLQYLRYFLKLNVEGASAHDAAGDVAVLEALFKRLEPKLSVEEMMRVSTEPVLLHHFNFGKYKGEKIKDVVLKDPGYIEWLLGQKEDPNSESKYNDSQDWIHSLKHHLGRRS